MFEISHPPNGGFRGQLVRNTAVSGQDVGSFGSDDNLKIGADDGRSSPGRPAKSVSIASWRTRTHPCAKVPSLWRKA